MQKCTFIIRKILFFTVFFLHSYQNLKYRVKIKEEYNSLASSKGESEKKCFFHPLFLYAYHKVVLSYTWRKSHQKPSLSHRHIMININDIIFISPSIFSLYPSILSALYTHIFYIFYGWISEIEGRRNLFER